MKNFNTQIKERIEKLPDRDKSLLSFIVTKKWGDNFLVDPAIQRLVEVFEIANRGGV